MQATFFNRTSDLKTAALTPDKIRETDYLARGNRIHKPRAVQINADVAPLACGRCVGAVQVPTMLFCGSQSQNDDAAPFKT
ncbi:hypothetical protein [Mixta calida]|uniref:hypothetical protein n=1 Tax=Mixta calida TaxID=665913 RepID=UPI000EC27E2B|nr:hypothetical protein [Mixta calida]MDU4290334.1 hypothetical protein [Mixta calida]HCW47365.1 hypothetical protein [Erwiniaceae bacterium]